MLSIILNYKIIIIIIILFILSFMLGYHIAKKRANKCFARFLMDLQLGKVKLHIIQANSKEELERKKNEFFKNNK